MAVDVVRWGPEQAAVLAALCAAALPAEDLSAEELLACCWADVSPAAVLAAADGSGAVAVVAQDHGHARVGFVTLIVVHPDARRRGVGRALLDAAHSWCLDEHGCAEVRTGAAAPFYLWPGVDVTHTEALCLFEDAGYWSTGAELNMRIPTTFRAEPPTGVELRRAAAGTAAAEAVLALVRREWPWWEAETVRAIDHGCCHAALADGGPPGDLALGFVCHSVNRAGWLGPMGTDPARQHGGVGTALVSRVCADLALAELTDVEIAWVGPVGFYAKAAGATVSRTFRSLTYRRRA